MSDKTLVPDDEGYAATRQEDPSVSPVGLDRTEVDPFATVLPSTQADPDATSLHRSVFADPYATRMTEVDSDGSNLSVTRVWPGGGGGGPGGPAGPSRYRPLRLHARGGLGEIFVAVDGELNREVALKEIQAKHGDHLDSRFRFVFEAEVTGGLEHPGIVPVYGLGTYEDGRPYYAMRFIRGESLKAAIKRIHAPGGAGTHDLRHSLEFRQILTRFVAVCQAIDYAHGRGVIHRDLKPDNVMLGPHGETLVVDWGLAKALDRPDPAIDTGPAPLRPLSGSDGSATLEGSVIGTPSYMSPEQAAGDIDSLGPPSDIFSLGATLYDLLAGHVPFRGKPLTELIESVRKAEFPSPRAVNKAVPPALEAICLKAMALKVEDRYPTAGALATDLERWLGDEPVSAYREPIWGRVARWARRHRTAVVGSLALLLTSLAALGISNVLIAREQARTARNFQRARSAVEQMLTEVGEVDLADVPQMEPVRRDLLGRALAFYLDFLQERGNDAWSRLETGRAFGRLGDIREMLGSYDQAEANYRTAIELLKELPDHPDARRALARARAGLGVLLKKSNRFVEAEAMLRTAVADREALSAGLPQNPDDGQALAAARYQLGTILAKLKGRGSESETAYRAAILEQEQRIARPASTPEARGELARYLNNLGILQSGDNPEAAGSTFRKALAILDELETRSASNAGFRWQRSRARSNLAVVLSRSSRLDEAGTLFSQARTGFESLAADFPSVPDYRKELGMALNNLGLLRMAQPAEGADPAQLFREALADQRRLVADFPSIPDHRLKLAITCLHLGALLRDSKPPEAETFHREGVQRTEALVAAYPQVPEYEAADGQVKIGLARFLTGRGGVGTTEAKSVLAGAIASLKAARRGNPRESNYARTLVEAHNDRADVLLKLGDHAGTAAEALQLAEVLPDRPEPRLAAARFLARSVDLARADTALAPAKRDEQVDQYARDALIALRKAFERGLPGGESNLDVPDFAPIRDRPDFQKLRQDVRSGIKRAVV